MQNSQYNQVEMNHELDMEIQQQLGYQVGVHRVVALWKVGSQNQDVWKVDNYWEL